MRKGANARLDWLGPVLAALVSSAALLGDPSEAATLVVAAVAACFGWTALARALLAGRRLPERRRATWLRLTCVAQCLSVVAVSAVLVDHGYLLPGGAVLVAGAALSALVWPWRWRLAQASADRDRGHDRQLAQQHLVAAGILLVLAGGSAIALSPVACLLLLALGSSSLVDAWDEWRRPRPAHRQPVPVSGRVLDREPARREVRPGARARRRRRRTPSRQGGRRVATRRS